MAFTGSVITDSFKQEVLEGVHDFRLAGSGGDTFKIALYSNAATLHAGTTAYTATGEIAQAGYTAGGEDMVSAGVTLVTVPNVPGKTAVIDFADVSWAAALTGVRGALIYNSSAAGNPAVAVLDFGNDVSSTTTFTVVFPPVDGLRAIVRAK